MRSQSPISENMSQSKIDWYSADADQLAKLGEQGAEYREVRSMVC